MKLHSIFLTEPQQLLRTDGWKAEIKVSAQEWWKAVECAVVPLCMAQCFYRNTAAWFSCACARIPPQSSDRQTWVFLPLCFTHSCLHSYLIDNGPSNTAPMETTNKVSYLPLVPALFCQVTRFVSFLLSASLTLFLPLPLSLSLSPFLCFSPSLTLPCLSLFFSCSLLWWTSLLVDWFPGVFPSEGHSGSFSPSARLRASGV